MSAKPLTDILAEWQEKEGPLLPILHAVQHEYGCIPSDMVPDIARALNLSRTEVHGVVSFYHDFKTEPQGKHVVQICRAEACQAMGARDLEQHAKSRLSLDWGQTSEDGNITLEPVYCLGNCACSPSVRIDDTIHARVSAERFDRLMEGLQAASEASA